MTTHGRGERLPVNRQSETSTRTRFWVWTCLCGWRSPQSSNWADAEQDLAWHCEDAGVSIDEEPGRGNPFGAGS